MLLTYYSNNDKELRIMFSVGPSSRSRATQHAYKEYLKQEATQTGCPFCSDDRVVIRDTFSEFKLLEARFKYEVWDDYKVLEHLMLSPKRHVATISELNNTEKQEYIDKLGEYESKGYTIYSRAPHDVTRSIDHLHTHLLKIGTDQARGMLYLRKPHFVAYFFGKHSK